jgi:hypothetical protein
MQVCPFSFRAKFDPCFIVRFRVVNKQLNDKERVAAALENPALVDALEQCLANVGLRGSSPD